VITAIKVAQLLIYATYTTAPCATAARGLPEPEVSGETDPSAETSGAPGKRHASAFSRMEEITASACRAFFEQSWTA